MNLIIPSAERPVIALDYDRTANSHVPFWRQFVHQAHDAGYDVIIVTMRATNEIEEIRELFGKYVRQIIATGYRAKREFCERLRINVAIWIDDAPQYILCDMGTLMDMHIVEGPTTKLKGYGFYYTDCHWEVPLLLQSFHRTKKGAYQAMRARLVADWNAAWQRYQGDERTKWLEDTRYPDGPNFPVIERICISKRRGRWRDPFQFAQYRVLPHTVEIEE